MVHPPLVARNGHTLKVLAVCRISTVHQDERSLDDQEASYRRWLQQNANLPYELEVLASQGSGECVERADYLRAIVRVESGEIDVVITEDLGRICRRVHAHLFGETCEDHNTRLIAVNDHIDTGGDDWRLHSYFAVMRHESYNRDTAARIRRSHRNRFQQGGVFQVPIFGYHKPPGAKSDSEVAKDPAAEPIIQRWFEMLDSGASYAEVADWLNQQGIRPGPLCRSPEWTGPMVSRVTHNPLLKGLRVRNNKMSKRINKTGRRKLVKAPATERLTRECKHLAFFEPEYYDRVISNLDRRNAGYRRKGKDGVDVRANVPKKRTTWPGQHLRCGICGRIYYWNGYKKGKQLKCSGSQNYRCWNAAEVNGAMVGRELAKAILAEIEALPEFDRTFYERVRAEWQEQEGNRDVRLQELVRQQQDLDLKISRITDAITRLPDSEALLSKLHALESNKADLLTQIADLKSARPPEPVLPVLDEIKVRAREVFTSLATDDPEVARLLHILIPNLRGYPYQLVGSKGMVLRAHVTLNLMALSPGGTAWEGAPEVLRRELVVDLFDPPQKVKHRAEIMARRESGEKEADVAQALGITKTAAQYAAALHRRLERLGIADPYQPLSEPPSAGRLRRHVHPRYRFEPLEPEAGAA